MNRQSFVSKFFVFSADNKEFCDSKSPEVNKNALFFIFEIGLRNINNFITKKSDHLSSDEAKHVVDNLLDFVE